MEKVMEEYEDIFSSPIEVPLHCQDKHSIDMTPGAPPHDVSIPHVTTQKKSTHVLFEATKFIERNQHICQHVHDILYKSNTKFNRIFLSWNNLTQWGPLLPKEGGMIQVYISGHLPIPFGTAP